MKLWGGRFEKDHRRHGGRLPLLHIALTSGCISRTYADPLPTQPCWANRASFPKEDADTIVEGLKGILQPTSTAGHVQFEVDAEDIHMNVEKLLTERIGAAGEPTAHRAQPQRSGCAGRTHVCEGLHSSGSAANCVDADEVLLTRIASKNLHTIMPGYTHLQKAQPITLAHHMMAYFQMLRRDWQRLEDAYTRADVMPLGSGALAGTTYPLNRRPRGRPAGLCRHNA